MNTDKEKQFGEIVQKRVIDTRTLQFLFSWLLRMPEVIELGLSEQEIESLLAKNYPQFKRREYEQVIYSNKS